MTELVQTEVRDHLLIITLNRPEARNAINSEVAIGLENAIDELETNAELWCGVLAAQGSAFCAGADLREIANGNGSSLSTSAGGFAGITQRKRTKPIIAAVDGPALAGGTEIVLACDLVVASKNASFGLPEVKRSLVAGAGGLFRLPKMLPNAIALEILLTGDPISPEKALHFGLINELCEEHEALDRAIVLGLRICENAPLAVWETYSIANQVLRSNEQPLFDESSRAMGRLMKTEDFKEGPQAFLEKRKPNWSAR
ncbi:MAG: crotonase/enoyl-CoA hydratase family protein [Acidimicrobiales bacterium]